MVYNTAGLGIARIIWRGKLLPVPKICRRLFGKNLTTKTAPLASFHPLNYNGSGQEAERWTL